jgi:alcohol dehydrogenase (cytochrome c)
MLPELGADMRRRKFIGLLGVRGRFTALDAKTGAILWRWYTLPSPGEIGSDTWPAGTDHAMRGGATI